MSITSSNNLAVNNSLTVNSNTILGVDNTSTLIINSKPTINSDLTINANINQISGNISTTGDITLNGNVILTKTLTGVGSSFKGITNTGTLSNIGTLSNTGTLSTGNLEITNPSFSYIDMKTSSGNSDFDVRIGCSNGSSGTSGQGTLTINAANTTITSSLTANSGTFSGITNNTSGITNNSTLSQVGNATFSNSANFSSIQNSGNFVNSGFLTQNSTANFNSDLNVSGLPYFNAPQTSLFPTSTSYSSKSGFEIFWNIKTSQGDTAFLNHSAGGSGGFNWWTIGILHNRINLMYLDDNKNLSLLDDVSCVSVTATGAMSCNSIATPTVSLNSQSIYSVMLFSNITGNGSNVGQKFLGNNGLAEVYLIDSGGAIYLPQSPSAGTKLTLRRIVGATTCNIYSYNGSATVLILSGQTNGTNVLSIANASGTTNATFVYYSGNCIKFNF